MLAQQIFNNPHDEKHQDEYNNLTKEPLVANRNEGLRLSNLLEEFYKNRKSSFEVRLILEELGGGLGGYRLQPQGNLFVSLKSPAERDIWLHESQKEMNDFAEFLYDKINQ